jgi:hypothetical protein
MAKELESLEIHPGEHGGHRIVHNFKRQTVKRSGAMSGGMYNERPPEEEHIFGSGQEEAALAHVKHAAFGKGVKGEAGAKEAPEPEAAQVEGGD